MPLVEYATQSGLHALEIGPVYDCPGVADDECGGRLGTRVCIDVGEVDAAGQGPDISGELAEGIGQDSGACRHRIGAGEQLDKAPANVGEL